MMNNNKLYDSVTDYFTCEYFTGEQREQICDFIYDTFATADHIIESIDDLTDEEFEQVVDFADNF